jgi:hypothetical protein
MIAATALTVEGAYYFIDTFGPEDKNDPIIKAGGLTPAQKEVGKGKVTNLALRSIGRNDYAVIDDGHPVEHSVCGRAHLTKSGCGMSPSQNRAAATGAFKESWLKIKAEIGFYRG